MFAYCGNNPIGFCDPDGFCREVGPNLLKVIDCARPDCPMSKYYVENETIREAVQVANAVMENLELGYAVGLGFYGNKNVMDAIDISGGQRYDLIYVGYTDGELFHYQAYYEGVEVWYAQIVGFDIHSTQEIRDNPISGTDLSWREDPFANSWTLYEEGKYIGMGGRIRIGFDTISFMEEINSIFT